MSSEEDTTQTYNSDLNFTNTISKIEQINSSNSSGENLNFFYKSQLSAKSQDRSDSLYYTPRLENMDQENCILCAKDIDEKKMPEIIQKALYNRYCSSVGYYYVNDISNLIKRKRCESYIRYKDLKVYCRRKEYFKKMYDWSNLRSKFDFLWKFHQFNKLRPMMYAKETYEIVLRNYHYKRQLQEKAIRRMLDKLTDTELEEEEIDLEDFMKDSIEFLERRDRVVEDRLLFEKDIQPIPMLVEQGTRSFLRDKCEREIINQERGVKAALAFAIRKNGDVYNGSFYGSGDSGFHGQSYQMLNNTTLNNIRGILEKEYDAVNFPSFLQNKKMKNSRFGDERGVKEVSDFFKNIDCKESLLNIIEKKKSQRIDLTFEKSHMVPLAPPRIPKNYPKRGHKNTKSVTGQRLKEKTKGKLLKKNSVSHTNGSKTITHSGITGSEFEESEVIRKQAHKIKNMMSKNSKVFISRQNRLSGLSTREEDMRSSKDGKNSRISKMGQKKHGLAQEANFKIPPKRKRKDANGSLGSNKKIRDFSKNQKFKSEENTDKNYITSDINSRKNSKTRKRKNTRKKRRVNKSQKLEFVEEDYKNTNNFNLKRSKSGKRRARIDEIDTYLNLKRSKENSGNFVKKKSVAKISKGSIGKGRNANGRKVRKRSRSKKSLNSFNKSKNLRLLESNSVSKIPRNLRKKSLDVCSSRNLKFSMTNREMSAELSKIKNRNSSIPSKYYIPKTFSKTSKRSKRSKKSIQSRHSSRKNSKDRKIHKIKNARNSKSTNFAKNELKMSTNFEKKRLKRRRSKGLISNMSSLMNTKRITREELVVTQSSRLKGISKFVRRKKLSINYQSPMVNITSVRGANSVRNLNSTGRVRNLSLSKNDFFKKNFCKTMKTGDKRSSDDVVNLIKKMKIDKSVVKKITKNSKKNLQSGKNSKNFKNSNKSSLDKIRVSSLLTPKMLENEEGSLLMMPSHAFNSTRNVKSRSTILESMKNLAATKRKTSIKGGRKGANLSNIDRFIGKMKCPRPEKRKSESNLKRESIQNFDPNAFIKKLNREDKFKKSMKRGKENDARRANLQCLSKIGNYSHLSQGKGAGLSISKKGRGRSKKIFGKFGGGFDSYSGARAPDNGNMSLKNKIMKKMRQRSCGRKKSFVG